MRNICDDIETYTSSFSGQTTYTPSLNRRKRKFSAADHHPTTKMHLTNFAHSFDMAKAALQESGILSGSSSSYGEVDDDPTNRTTEEAGLNTNSDLNTTQEARRVILELGHSNASEYFRSFMDIVCPAYPCINVDYARKTLNAIFKAPFSSQEPHSGCEVDLIDIEICKVVLAVGMIIQEDSPGPLGANLEAYLIWTTDTVVKRDQAQVEDVILSTLMVST